MDDITKWGWMGAAGLFLVKELFQWMKGSTKEHMQLMQQNTLAIVELKVRIEYLSKQLDLLPKLAKDVDQAHKAIREMQSDLTN